MTVWLNGQILAADQARIDPADRGFTLGDGLFETIRAAGGRPLRLASHLARLHAGAEAFRLSIPFSDHQIIEGMEELLSRTGLADAILRLTLTRGVGPRGLLPSAHSTPTVMISAAPAGSLPGAVRAIIATVTRRNEFSPLSRFKTLNYLDNIMARQEAADKGADDALLINSRGHVVESTVANLFVVMDDTVITPPLSDGALPGVMRADLITKLNAVEDSLTPDDLVQASEAFLTSATGVRPLLSVDGTPIGGDGPGPLTLHLGPQV